MVTVFMLMNVVPTFVNMYESMGMKDDLPTPTAVIMSLSEFVRSSGGLFLLIFILVSLFVSLKYEPNGSPSIAIISSLSFKILFDVFF